MKKAFGLIELLVVICVIAVLAAIVLPIMARHVQPKPLPRPPPAIYTTDSVYDSRLASYVCEFVYDGCQYLMVRESISHKGNCTNSIHSYVRQLEK